MISLEFPHMGVNDPHAPVKVQMWNTWNIKETDSLGFIISWIASVARDAPGGKLKNLVFSSHGSPGYLQIGAGINLKNAFMFGGLAGKVDKIWFRACSVADAIPGAPVSSDGVTFCRLIAQVANCYVVASKDVQTALPNRVLPYGKLDTFEGLLLSYGPNGQVPWSQHYPEAVKTDPNRDNSWTENPD